MFGHGRTRVICVHAVAVAAAVAAIGVTLADPPALRVTPFAPFFIAAAVATVIGGFAPGLVAIGLGVLTALVWRIPPVPTLLVVPFIGLSVPAAWLISRY